MSYIATTHMLARELLDKPDGFLVVNVGGQEYIVESIRRKFTYANLDDSVMYWSINVRDERGEDNKKN